MAKRNKFKTYIRHSVLAIVALLLLSVTIFIMVRGLFRITEEEAFNKLHMETQQIKRDISLQIHSDRENLTTMANFAGELYDSGESYELLFKSFKAIGLFENIGIFLPDNTLVTKAGQLEVQHIRFSDEVQKGEFISGRVADLTVSGKEVVRMAAPVKSADGSVVALMYGIINLDNFEQKYEGVVHKLGADVFVFEGLSGDFIVDTKYETRENISKLATSEFQNGFSYQLLNDELNEGRDGFSSFKSPKDNAFVYAHYAPLGVSDWQIMLTQAEDVVFAEAQATVSYMLVMASIIFCVMLLYILFIFVVERKTLKVSTNASAIRKILLGISHDISKMNDALGRVSRFARARAAFYVDTYGENHSFTMPTMEKYRFNDADWQFFSMKLLQFISRKRKKRSADIYLISLKVDAKLKHDMPDFYDFLIKNKVSSVSTVIIYNNNSNVSLLGVVNPKEKDTDILLKEIAICFSMAIYNKKHLLKTESMAVTDALTGVANRMAYKRDIKEISERKNNQLTCIYIDVNELNYFNNTYGHAAGDQLLVYVAETLMGEFSDSFVYRMGGDEFLVFTENLSRDLLVERLTTINNKVEEMKYHISIGVKSTDGNLNLEELVSEAEKMMYEEKARYYQKGELSSNPSQLINENTKSIRTGIPAVDEVLYVMRRKYRGVYYVSLDTDHAVQILAPATYFVISGEENRFSDTLKDYIHETVKPEFHRILLNFMQYDVLKTQLEDGRVLQLNYTKKDGDKIVMSVQKASGINSDEFSTVWTFETIGE